MGKIRLSTSDQGVMAITQRAPFLRVNNDTVSGKDFFCIVPVSSDVAFGSGCVTELGDAPESGDVITGPIFGRFSTVSIVGTAFVYYYED